MTAEEMREAAKVMLAAAEGKKIQVRQKGVFTWDLTDPPRWNWNGYEYRVKPEPQYRPFANAELPSLVGKVIVAKCGNTFLITEIVLGLVGFANRRETPAYLLQHFTFLDGSPCGVEVSE